MTYSGVSSWLIVDGIDSAAVGKMINNLLDFGKMNKESLGELFITLLVKVMTVPPAAYGFKL